MEIDGTDPEEKESLGGTKKPAGGRDSHRENSSEWGYTGAYVQNSQKEKGIARERRKKKGGKRKKRNCGAGVGGERIQNSAHMKQQNGREEERGYVGNTHNQGRQI